MRILSISIFFSCLVLAGCNQPEVEDEELGKIVLADEENIEEETIK